MFYKSKLALADPIILRLLIVEIQYNDLHMSCILAW